MTRDAISATVIAIVLGAYGFCMGRLSAPQPAPQIIRTVLRPAPRVSEKVFLLQRDKAFQELYAHWRACGQSMARIEEVARHERYDRLDTARGSRLKR